MTAFPKLLAGFQGQISVITHPALPSGGIWEKETQLLLHNPAWSQPLRAAGLDPSQSLNSN